MKKGGKDTTEVSVKSKTSWTVSTRVDRKRR